MEFTLLGLQVVREVAARGSFTAAAVAMGYTQSAVSRQVAATEAAAGAALFERTARGVRLTDAGRVVLRHGSSALDGMAVARRELGDLHGTGRLRVGAFPTAIAAMVPRAMVAFGVGHPGVRVVLKEGITRGQLRRVAAGTVDIAVVGPVAEGGLDGTGVELTPLLDDPLLLAVARDHRLAGAAAVGLDELRGERWIAGNAEAGETFLAAWGPQRPRVEFVVGEWTAKLGLVAAGLGVTLVPGLAVPALRADVALVRIRSPHPASRAVSLATRPGAAAGAHLGALAEQIHTAAAALAVEVEGRIRTP